MSIITDDYCDDLIGALKTQHFHKPFLDREIDVNSISRSVTAQKNGYKMSVGGLLTNGDIINGAIVIMGTLHDDKFSEQVYWIDDFVKQMDDFFKIFIRYRTHQVYGCLVGCDGLETAVDYASEKGVLLLNAADGLNHIKIINDNSFKPKDFAKAFVESGKEHDEIDEVYKMPTQRQPWQDAVDEVWKLFKETDERFRETDERLDTLFTETDARLDARFTRTEEQFRKTDKKINKLEGSFSNHWGKMVEALVEPSALKLFQDRGIDVKFVHPNMDRSHGDRHIELDLVLENGHELVIIETKSQLKSQDVTDFIETLGTFLDFYPAYRGYTIYGGMAGLKVEENASKEAYRKGLFVLNAVGDGKAEIKNDKKFRPKNFAHN